MTNATQSLLSGAVLSIALASSGCLLSPWNDEEFDTTTTAVQFSGCSEQPSSQIQIQAGDWNTGQFTTIATTTSSSNVQYTDSTQQPWYCWRTDVVVPDSYWRFEAVNDEFNAVVKVLDGGNATWTYDNDPHQCTQAPGVPQMTDSAPCAVSPQHSGNTHDSDDPGLDGSIGIRAQVRGSNTGGGGGGGGTGGGSG